MKKANNNRKDILKGVSTLDEFSGSARIALLLLIIIAFGGSIRAGHSVLDLVDPSFNPQIQTNSFGVKQVNAIVPVADGKMLFAGIFNSYNRQPVGRIIRLNANATLDTTFNNNVLIAPSFPNQIVLQADGKILIRGVSLTLNGQTGPARPIVRLNTDGTPDPTFNYTEDERVSEIAVDAGGRIVLCGLFPEGSGFRKAIRLNADGSLDPSFVFASNTSVDRIATQNNKVIVSIGAPPTVQRFDENGNPDGSFTPLSPTFSPVKFLVQPDNKILVLTRRDLQRLNENGGSDAGFTPPPTFSNDGRSLWLAGDGRITYSFGSSTYPIRRILASGAADPSFTPYDANFTYHSFGVQPDGGILIGDLFNGGSGTSIPNNFMRLHPNGSVDTNFNVGGTGFQSANPGSIRSITVLPGGKLIIAGRFDTVNDSLRFKIARLNADSTLDTTFQTSVGGSGNTFTQVLDIYKVAAQADGKLIVSGMFTYTLNGATKNNFVRLNTDGSIDPTFVSIAMGDSFSCCGGGQNKPVILSDGKIAVGTSRRTFIEDGVPARLNADGTRDTSFAANIFSSVQIVYVYDIAIQPDGKVVVGGRYIIPPTGVTKSFVLRLNADGSVDPTFQISEDANKEVAALSLLPNGKILIVKGNAYALPAQQSNVLRLNPDGTPDATFNAGTSANGRINAILLLPTGKIFVGGKFTTFNGQARQNLAQLNADGSLNTTTYNLNEEVLSLTVDDDGRVLVGGNFTIITVGGGGGANRSYIARLIDSNVSPAQTRFDFDGDGKADIGIFSSLNRSWSILNSQTSQPVTTQFGLGSDRIAAADYDGDGKADIAVYRPSDGNWYLLRSTAGFGVVRFGLPEDKPVPADYDGDEKADVAVWRPSTGDWYVLRSTDGQTLRLRYGLTNDIPLADADFDGDGKADMAVWRPSDGNFYWLASGSAYESRVVHFGQEGDIPSVGDFNADGKTDLVIFRPSEGNWYQFLTQPNGNYSFQVTNFGLKGDEPVAADYDGDGRTDIALRRNGVWHMLLSGQSYSVVTFGNPGAQAIAALPAEVTIAATEDLPEK